MKTGQTSWQAPQVVQAHSTSSVVRPPIERLVLLGGAAASAVAVLEALEQHVQRAAVGHAEAHVVAQVVDDLHRRQRLARVVGGAEVGAARALGAGEAVQQRLPGEVLPALDDAGRGHVVRLHVQLGQHAALAEVAEVDVGQRRDDVAVLRVEQVVQEREQDDDVHPPGRVDERAASPKRMPKYEIIRQRDRAQDRRGVAAHRDQARLQHDAPEEREADDDQHQAAEEVDAGVERRRRASRPARSASENDGNRPWISVSTEPIVMTRKPQKMKKWYLLPIALTKRGQRLDGQAGLLDDLLLTEEEAHHGIDARADAVGSVRGRAEKISRAKRRTVQANIAKAATSSTAKTTRLIGRLS